MGREKQALDDAMRRWEKMDERYRLRIGRQIKAMDRLLNANRIMLGSLQHIAAGVDPAGAAKDAQQAIDHAAAVLVVAEDEQEETNG